MFLQTGSEFHLGSVTRVMEYYCTDTHVVSTSLGSPFSRSQVEEGWVVPVETFETAGSSAVFL